MKKTVYLKFITLVIMVISLSACGVHIKIRKSEQLEEQTQNNSILVVGYFDDSEAQFNLGWGFIKQIKPATSEAYKELRANDDGLFYLEDLPVGSYKLATLRGREKGLLSTQPWVMRLPEPSRDKAFKLTELRANNPGVYFLGSYKLKLVHKGGFFGSDKHETVALSTPTEKDVLKKLLKHSLGTKWEKIIKTKIDKLK